MNATIAIFHTPGDMDALTALIEKQGFHAHHEPILSVEFIDAPFPVPDLQRPLVFTSVNAVAAYIKAGETGRGNPVYVVGNNTADAAAKAGFTNIHNAKGTAAELTSLLVGALDKNAAVRPLYVRAQDVSVDLVKTMAQHGISMDQVIAYRTVAANSLSLNLLKKLDKKEVVACMFFSRKGAETFAGLVQQYDRAFALKATKALCIGDGVVQSVSVLPFAQTLVSQTPDRDGMMELVENISVI